MIAVLPVYAENETCDSDFPQVQKSVAEQERNAKTTFKSLVQTQGVCQADAKGMTGP